LTVGAVAELDLKTARERAAEMLDNLRRGLDPKCRTGNEGLREVFDKYLEARKDLRPASIRDYTASFGHLEGWHDLPLRSITSDMVEARHRTIAAEVAKNGRGTGAFTANAAMRLFRVLYNFSAERTPDLPPNPVRRLRRQWYAEPPRERILREDELPTFYAALNTVGPLARDYILLMLFTGLRRGEAASLKWTDIDLSARIIRVPSARTKTRLQLDLPMCDVVHDILVSRRAIGNAVYVFPGPSGHIRGANEAFATIATTSGIQISAHDLRRTYITVAESTDISPLALKALVNHSLGGGVTENYIRMTVERLREPAQRVADRLKAMCGIAPIESDNVKKLRTKADSDHIET
jgi:integrase